MREEVGVKVQVLQDQLITNRVIADLGDSSTGNTLVLIGGVHGNEVMGLAAIHKVINQIKSQNIKISGRLLALTGNLEASKLGIRYLHQDLNRLWTRENLDALHYHKLDTRHTEFHEMEVLYDHIKDAIDCCSKELILIDLHTTSSETSPFVVTSNSEKCSQFTNAFPLPVISGITGFLNGTLFEYLNQLGHTGIAFEAGQHQSLKSQESHENFIWLALKAAGICEELSVEDLDIYSKRIENQAFDSNTQFKIISRYKIAEDEQFEMHPGYFNFKVIEKGEVLAKNQFGDILSPYSGFIFMPLYQAKGDDGFFIIVES